MSNGVIFSIIVMVILGGGFAILLFFAHKKLQVHQDLRIEKIIKMLPGINCGACGFSACRVMAEVLVKGDKDNLFCPIAGDKVMAAIYKILGLKMKASLNLKAFVKCGADSYKRKKIAKYQGPDTCKAANMFSSYQLCNYGCLGFGDCEKVCPVSAINIINGAPIIDLEKCIGCGKCVTECPRGIIELLEVKYRFLPIVACSNKERAKDVKEACEVGCIGCGVCVKIGPENGFQLKENLSVVSYKEMDKYKEIKFWEKAVEKCPMNTIQIRKLT
jgi:Na+-translocating ferredoxin:NAD+ oxidoreductase RNF subunit RnfB